MANPQTLIHLEKVSKFFPAADGSEFQVLNDITMSLHENEVVALLGKSGSGKSTILRIMAGLLGPSTGQVTYRGTPLRGANPGVAMVFQSFALMPWLTVLGNVELGLRAAGVPEAERRARAMAAIDQIGLDGFETAYPRELSGGMRQRVGFARALVLRPDVLLMDEPFSALDPLTTNNLRDELMSLWAQPDFPTKCICLVTHNIEEAVLLASRVIVLGSNPGHIVANIAIDLPRPRDRNATAFEKIVDRLYGALTGRDDDGRTRGSASIGTPTNNPLPHASTGGLAGLVGLVSAGSTDLVDLGDELGYEVDDLLPLVDAARMLDLLTVNGVNVALTPAGEAFATSDIQAAKQVFATQAATRAPLVRTIVSGLRKSPEGTMRDGFFRDLLHRGFNAEETEKQLDLAIDWGRYGELFDYDANSGELVLTS